MSTGPISAKMFIAVSLSVVAVLGCGPVAYRSPTPTPMLGPPAQAFIASNEAYPFDWGPLPCESQLCQSGESAYEQSFIPDAQEPGQFRQEVFRLDGIEAASTKFATYRRSDFHKSGADPQATDFYPPEELPYVSPIADEYYFACGYEFGLVCRMIARYRNYFVYFYFDMDDGRGYGLTFSEVNRILRWLDDQASKLLGATVPPQ